MKTTRVRTLQDDVVEGDEVFSVVVVGVFGAVVDLDTVSADAVIADDDRYVLSAAPVSVSEDVGDVGVVFALSPPAPGGGLSGTATASQAGAAGPGSEFASPGQDFDAVTRYLAFPAGATSATVSIPIRDDALVEPTEHFTVTGRIPQVGSADARVAILDDGDGGGCPAGEHASGPAACHGGHTPPPCGPAAQSYVGHTDPGDLLVHGVVTLAPCGAGTPKSYTGSGTTVTEGVPATVRFSVFPAPAAGETLTLAYDTAGTMLVRPGLDFIAVSGALSFTDTASQLAVTVPTIDDSDVETLPESFTVRLLSAGSEVASAVVTILDNDGGGGPTIVCCGPFENPTPPIDRSCPGGSHAHNDPASGWYCHDDHGSPTNPCADVEQTGVWTDHTPWSVEPCNYTAVCATSNGVAICLPPPPEPGCPTSPTNFHRHAGYCHDHDTTPHEQCLPGRAQHWTEHTGSGHRSRVTLACPPPTTKALGDVAAGGSRLIVAAGLQLILNVEVDVASTHVDKTRTLRVEAVTGCASPALPVAGTVPTPEGCAIAGTHFVLLDRVITFTASTAQPHSVELDTHVTLDHGLDARRVEFRITDDEHPHMPAVVRSAWIEPPLRGTQ